jgi:hypothetical protein
VRRIGIVSPAASETTVLFNSFRARLKELGYIEGHTIELDFRLAAGALDRVPALASNLLRQRVDVLVADGAHVVSVLQSMTKTVPTIAIILTKASSLSRQGRFVAVSSYRQVCSRPACLGAEGVGTQHI